MSLTDNGKEIWFYTVLYSSPPTEDRVSSDLLNYALTCYCRVEKSFNDKGVWFPLFADCDDVSITYV